MKTILCILFSLSCLFSLAQSPYEDAMKQALSTWKSGNSTDAMAQFERIANVEKDNWIPLYYQALVATTSSFQTTDPKAKQSLIQKALSLLPSDPEKTNSEWLVVRALALTADLASDPMNKAMELSPQVMASYQQALAMDPNNPRALAGLADFQIQSKKFMGGSTEQECKDLKKALSLFENDKKEIPFYPNWGKERAEQALAACKP